MSRQFIICVLFLILLISFSTESYGIKLYSDTDPVSDCFVKAVPISGFAVKGGTTSIEWTFGNPACNTGICALNMRTVTINAIKLRRYLKSAQPRLSSITDSTTTRIPDSLFGYYDSNRVWHNYLHVTPIIQPSSVPMSVDIDTFSIPSTINDADIVALNNNGYTASDYVFTLEFAFTASHNSCKCPGHIDEIHVYEGTIEVQYDHLGNNTGLRTLTWSYSSAGVTHAAATAVYDTCNYRGTSDLISTGMCNPVVSHSIGSNTTTGFSSTLTHTYARVDPEWPIDEPEEDPTVENYGARNIPATNILVQGTARDVFGFCDAHGNISIPEHTHSPSATWTSLLRWIYLLNCEQ